VVGDAGRQRKGKGGGRDVGAEEERTRWQCAAIGESRGRRVVLSVPRGSWPPPLMPLRACRIDRQQEHPGEPREAFKPHTHTCERRSIAISEGHNHAKSTINTHFH